ncbi:hypothetical protein cyc_02151 [Cyclospora cayetanensis]|uniref:Uncharacterized protein n=1 Tax=Cyclospora cayetanensis TaxID=88456 RepID=A0A1D3CTU0_9EIME|nr:hypothetical protein cyc_02151 [Cyclospora cayetanensis]
MRLRASTRLLQQTVLIQHLKKQQRELLPRAAAEAVEGISLLQQQQQQQFAAWQQQQQASDAFLHKLRRHMENSAEGLATRAVSLECRRSEAQKALQQLEERRRSLERQLENCLADIERVKEGLRSAHAAEEELHVDVQRQQSSSRRLERRLLQQQQQWETARDSLLLFQQAAAEAAAAQLEGAEVAAAVADADDAEHEAEEAALAALREIAAVYRQVQQEAAPYLNDLQSHQPPAPPEEARPARDTLPCMPVAAPGVKALANPQPAGTYVVDVPPPQAPLALEAKGRETGFQFFTLDADSGPPTPAMGPADFPVQPSEQASGDGDTPAAGVALRELRGGGGGKQGVAIGGTARPSALPISLGVTLRGHRFRVSPDHPTDALAVRLEVVVQILKERDLSEEAS